MTSRELLEATKADGGAMPLIVSLDDSVRELKGDLHNFKREVKDGMTDIRLDVAALSGEVKATNEHSDKNLAEYKAIASDARTDNARLEGKIDAVNARLDALEGKVSHIATMTGIIVAVFGVIITVLIAAIQLWKG